MDNNKLGRVTGLVSGAQSQAHSLAFMLRAAHTHLRDMDAGEVESVEEYKRLLENMEALMKASRMLADRLTETEMDYA